MADFTGIQAVTETLRQLLLERMQEHSALTDVTTFHPDHDDTPDGPWVNLFLYGIHREAALKEPGPSGTVESDRCRFGRPPLSLDLHYLITTAGLIRADPAARSVCSATPWVTLHDHPIIAKDDPGAGSGSAGGSGAAQDRPWSRWPPRSYQHLDRYDLALPPGGGLPRDAVELRSSPFPPDRATVERPARRGAARLRRADRSTTDHGRCVIRTAESLRRGGQAMPFAASATHWPSRGDGCTRGGGSCSATSTPAAASPSPRPQAGCWSRCRTSRPSRPAFNDSSSSAMSRSGSRPTLRSRGPTSRPSWSSPGSGRRHRPRVARERR